MFQASPPEVWTFGWSEAISTIAVLFSLLTWWRHRKTSHVIARGDQGDIFIDNVGGRPAYDINVTATGTTSGHPVLRSDTWWPEKYLPLESLMPGNYFGLPSQRVGGVDPVVRVEVVWTTPTGRWTRQRAPWVWGRLPRAVRRRLRPTSVAHLSCIGEGRHARRRERMRDLRSGL